MHILAATRVRLRNYWLSGTPKLQKYCRKAIFYKDFPIENPVQIKVLESQHLNKAFQVFAEKTWLQFGTPDIDKIKDSG